VFTGSVGITGSLNTSGKITANGGGLLLELNGGSDTFLRVTGNRGNGDNLHVGNLEIYNSFSSRLVGEIRGITGAGGTQSNSGQLAFYTNDNGTYSERIRITSGGYLKASNTGTYLGSTGAYHELRQSAQSTASTVISATNASFDNNVLAVGTTRTASSAFNLIAAYANDFNDLKFVVRGDGNVGIGLIDPANKLQVNVSSNTTTLYNDNSYPLQIKNTSTTNNSYVGMYFGTGLGVGVTIQALYTNASTRSEGNLLFSTRNSGGSLEIGRAHV
jgi:hypothetical protein